MADKVIEVPGVGNVAFPAYMSDDQIGFAIRNRILKPQIPGMEHLGGSAPEAGQPPAPEKVLKPLTGLGKVPAVDTTIPYSGSPVPLLGGGMEESRAAGRKMVSGTGRIASGEVTGGAADILEGGGALVGPGVGAFLLPLAPKASLSAAAAGTFADQVTKHLTEWMGLTPDQARLAGDAAGLYVGGKAFGRYRKTAVDEGGGGLPKFRPLPGPVKTIIRAVFKGKGELMIRGYEAFVSGEAKPQIAPPPLGRMHTLGEGAPKMEAPGPKFPKPKAVPKAPKPKFPGAPEPWEAPGVEFKTQPKPNVPQAKEPTFPSREPPAEPRPKPKGAPPVTEQGWQKAARERAQAEAGAETETGGEGGGPVGGRGPRQAGPLQAHGRVEPNVHIDMRTYAKDANLFDTLIRSGTTKEQFAAMTDEQLSGFSKMHGYDAFTGKELHRTPAQFKQDMLARWQRYEQNGRDLSFAEAVDKYGPRAGYGQ